MLRATRRATASTLRDLLASAGPSVNMPSVAVASFAGPSVALLASTMPSVSTPSFTVASLTMPCALRTLARAAAGPTLPLLRRSRARVAAACVRAVVFARQRHPDQPLDVAEVAELLAACHQRDRGAFGAGARGA